MWRVRELFQLLAHYPDAFSSRGWARPKLAMRTFRWLSQVGGRSPAPGVCIGWKVEWGEEPGLQPRHSDVRHRCVSHCATHLSQKSHGSQGFFVIIRQGWDMI